MSYMKCVYTYMSLFMYDMYYMCAYSVFMYKHTNHTCHTSCMNIHEYTICAHDIYYMCAYSIYIHTCPTSCMNILYVRI